MTIEEIDREIRRVGAEMAALETQRTHWYADYYAEVGAVEYAAWYRAMANGAPKEEQNRLYCRVQARNVLNSGSWAGIPEEQRAEIEESVKTMRAEDEAAKGTP